MPFYDRKHPAHFPALERHNTPIIVFLTVCTKNRKAILARDSSQKILLAGWQAADQWLVGRYVIMPDHLHLFCAPATLERTPLHQWVRFWKSHVTRHWSAARELPIWQRNFWDTQLRRGESYDEKWEYVLANPVRAGLVTRPEDWPFQGELYVLPW